MRNHFAMFAFSLFAFPAIGVAQATIYDYTGSPMNGTVTGYSYTTNSIVTTSFCCDTLDGTITLSAPLLPGLLNESITPTYADFSISNVAIPIYVNTFEVTTNDSGQIIQWDLSLAGPQELSIISTLAGDSGQYTYPADGNVYDVDLANTTAGSWTEAPVPLPSAAWLMLSGIGGLGFLAVRQPRGR